MLHRSDGLARSFRPSSSQPSKLLLHGRVPSIAPRLWSRAIKLDGIQARNFSTSLRGLDQLRRGKLNSPISLETAGNGTSPRKATSGRIFLALAIGLSAAWYISATLNESSSDKHVLDDQKFVPYRVTSTVPVSPTAFILTVNPDLGHLTPEEVKTQLSSPWLSYDLWSVEFKQPQLQIARHYTPLPPDSWSNPKDGMRFFIRAVDGGEVSTYLSKLSVGSKVELRGPHGGFDLHSRLGNEGKEVVFLAGGTGIASAMQAAYSLLDDEVQLGNSEKQDEEIRVSIVWAVRKREDVQFPPQSSTRSRSWNPFGRSVAQSSEISSGFEQPSLVSKQLLAMKEKYGERLRIAFVVDEENTFITESDLHPALQRRGKLAPDQAPSDKEPSCQYHSQAMHISMADGDPNSGRKDQHKQESCACPLTVNGRWPGKNILLVSGPDGFVTAYAGARRWEGGGQRQGALGGLIGDMQRRDPASWKNWIVLKL